MERFVRVIVVEDSEHDLRILCDLLEEEGFEVVGCKTAAGALSELQTRTFGVAVVDLGLPDVSGTVLIEQFRQLDPQMRVIIYTGLASYDSAKQAVNLGAFAYIEKLDETAELLRHVQRAHRDRVRSYAADLEAAVVQRTEELAQSNQELQNFASVVAHDLRSPLLTISGFCHLLQEECGDDLTATGEEYLRSITDAAERLSQMIEDLLNVARAGRNTEKFVAVDLRQSAHQALANLDGVVRESGAAVDIGELPAVMGQRSQLIQLFQNLIDNALKFRGAQPPKVEVRAQLDGQQWIVSVSDNGIGIAPQHFDKIFRVFQRLHRHEYPGTGIGLAVCKKIVDRHGGRIWVESEAGSGATFFFTLPKVE